MDEREAAFATEAVEYADTDLRVRFSLNIATLLGPYSRFDEELLRSFSALLCIASDAGEDMLPIGEASGILIDCSRVADAGESISELLDARSQDDYEIYRAFFVDDEWRDEFVETIGDEPKNLLHVHRLFVGKPFRGRGLGGRLLATLNRIDVVPKSTVVALLPSVKDEQDAYSPEATARLNRQCESAGFMPWKKTGFLYNYVP